MAIWVEASGGEGKWLGIYPSGPRLGISTFFLGFSDYQHVAGINWLRSTNQLEPALVYTAAWSAQCCNHMQLQLTCICYNLRVCGGYITKLAYAYMHHGTHLYTASAHAKIYTHNYSLCNLCCMHRYNFLHTTSTGHQSLQLNIQSYMQHRSIATCVCMHV